MREVRSHISRGRVGEEAARLLRKQRDAILRRWRDVIWQRFDEIGVGDRVTEGTVEDNTTQIYELVLSGLKGNRDIPGSSQHWVQDALQYQVALAEVIGIINDLKYIIGAMCRSDGEKDHGQAMFMTVAQCIDEIIQSTIAAYQQVRESEWQSLRQRFQNILQAWNFEEDLSRADSPEEVFQVAADHLHQLFPLVGSVVRLYDGRGGLLTELTDLARFPSGQRIQLGRCEWAADMARRRGQPVVEHVHDLPDTYPNQMRLFGEVAIQETLWGGRSSEDGAVACSSVACVPLKGGGETLGVLVLLSSETTGFAGTVDGVLGDLARVLGPAFARAMHARATRREKTEAEVVARIGQLLLDLPTVEDLLHSVASAIREFRDYDAVSLYRVREDGSIRKAATAGRDYVQEENRVPVSVGRCAEEKTAIGPYRLTIGDMAPLTEMDFPIRKSQRIIGVLRCFSRLPGAFTRGERAGLRHISTHIGVAMEKADMLEQWRQDREELERVHRQLSAIMQSTAVGIASLNKKGVYTHWSPSCETLLEYPAEEVVGELTPVDLAAYPYDLSEVLYECLREGRVTREEMMLTRSGTPLIIQEMFVPMRGEDGEHLGYTSCLVNVTDKREAEEELRRERNKLNLVVEAMGAGLALFDSDMELQWANTTLMDWFGVEEAAGQSCRAVYGCGEKHHSNCPLYQVAENGGCKSGTIERTDDHGAWKCFLHVVTQVQFGREQYLVLTSDVTRQRRQKEQMQLIDRLTRALQGSLDLQRVLHLTLTCVTAGHALGFNRAFVFLRQEDDGLRGSRAVGPTSREEAHRIWEDIDQEGHSLEELLEMGPGEAEGKLTQIVQSLHLPVNDPASLMAEVMKSHTPQIVRDARDDPRVNPRLVDELSLEEFVAVPLVSHDEPLGVMIADNKYSGAPIDESAAEQLRVFATQASLAIANARAYQKLTENLEELRATQQKLVESERLASVGRMANRLAHQMRTPLALIGGYARAIERAGPEDETVKRNAEIIYEEEQELENEVNEILEFSRPIQADPEPGDLNALVENTVERFQLDLEEKDIVLSLDLDAGLPRVLFDHSLIVQVLTNILRNAEEAIEGCETRRIDITTTHQEDAAEVVIHDSGEGMDEETQEKVFAPFYTTKTGGTGLGLAIARRIMREHNGAISCRSQRGAGSAFRLQLPLAERKPD